MVEKGNTQVKYIKIVLKNSTLVFCTWVHSITGCSKFDEGENRFQISVVGFFDF